MSICDIAEASTPMDVGSHRRFVPRETSEDMQGEGTDRRTEGQADGRKAEVVVVILGGRWLMIVCIKFHGSECFIMATPPANINSDHTQHEYVCIYVCTYIRLCACKIDQF